MTEIEKIQYTKSFIDKLANGIDPISGNSVPENEIINNVRISRCLFYVSDILRQVIDNGGITPKPKLRNDQKNMFYITDEQLKNYAYSSTPISLSEIARNINSLIDTETIRPISYKDIAGWLVNIGALQEIENSEGKKTKHPTDTGKELGISLQERDNGLKTYTVVVYNRSAQQLIIDNLQSILEFKNNDSSET